MKNRRLRLRLILTNVTLTLMAGNVAFLQVVYQRAWLAVFPITVALLSFISAILEVVSLVWDPDREAE